MRMKRVFKVLICFVVFFGLRCGGKTAVPEGLIGVWKTSATEYADRFFEIKRDQVIFGTGEGKSDIYPITKIEIGKLPETEGTLFTILYKNIEGQKYKFSFYYDPTNQGTIRFKNQKEMVWIKAKN